MTSTELMAFLGVLFLPLCFVFVMGVHVGRSQGINLVLEKHTDLCYEQEYKDYSTCRDYLVIKGLEKGK